MVIIHKKKDKKLLCFEDDKAQKQVSTFQFYGFENWNDLEWKMSM